MPITLDAFQTLIASHRAEHGALRVGRATFDGQAVWIKQSGPQTRNGWNALHRLARYMPIKMLRPTAVGDRRLALGDEAERLRRYRAHGVNVPEVLYYGDDAIVLADCGEPLARRLRGEPDSAVRLALLVRTIGELAGMHRRGLSHGRPFLKDIVLQQGGGIAFLDLEEAPTRVMSLAQAQSRDLWLFLQSAARYCDALDVLFEAYTAAAGSGHLAPLRSFVRLARPLRALADVTVGARLGTDVRRALAANRALETAFARAR